jgi:adenylate kinase
MSNKYYSVLLILSITFASFFTACGAPQKVFIIMGIPGSGKTTTAQEIALAHPEQIAYFSTGELLRNAAKESSVQAMLIKELLSQGKLIPVEIQMPIVKEAFDQCKKPIILFDGFFRTMVFCNAFQELAHAQNLSIEKIITLHVSQQCAIDRLRKRNRHDDSLVLLNQRTRTYLEGFESVAEHYSAKGLLITVNGEQPQEKVVQAIEKIIL